MFDRSLLAKDGELPSLFKNKAMFDHNDSEDELSNLLHQIEGEEWPRKKERQDLNARLNLNLNEQRVSK